MQLYDPSCGDAHAQGLAGSDLNLQTCYSALHFLRRETRAKSEEILR